MPFLRPLLLTAFLPGAALALDPSAALSGEGLTERVLTPESLAALPAQEVDVTYETSKGPKAEHYRGVPLWDVLAAEPALADHKAALRRVVLVTARDDHQVAFSLGEILPDFGGQPVLIAWTVDGQPTPDGLRMVVPGDKRGGRYIKDVVRLELR